MPSLTQFLNTDQERQQGTVPFAQCSRIEGQAIEALMNIELLLDRSGCRQPTPQLPIAKDAQQKGSVTRPLESKIRPVFGAVMSVRDLCCHIISFRPRERFSCGTVNQFSVLPRRYAKTLRIAIQWRDRSPAALLGLAQATGKSRDSRPLTNLVRGVGRHTYESYSSFPQGRIDPCQLIVSLERSRCRRLP